MPVPGSFEAAAEAFTRKALVYDEFAQDHPNLTRMRKQVRDHILRFVNPPGRILELNAGTGADAVYLARLGFHVHATDVAQGMVARLSAKVEGEGLYRNLTAEQRSFTDLDGLRADPFDAVFSNLGGLNCIRDLRPIAQQLPRLLRPGGVVTWVIMPPLCLWDLIALFRGDWRLASRRWSRNGVLANIEGVRVNTFYHSPEAAAAAFDRRFTVERLEGLSVFAPPADRKRFAWRFPRLYRVLVCLDARVADRRPFRAWGDFFILTLRYSQPA